MPNGIKYSTTIPSGSLKRGNVALGVSGSLGPTSTTGFYSMPAPQSGKYIIIKVSSSGVPNFFAPVNDSELIRLARQEGAVGADTGSVAAILNWMTTQENLEAINFEYEGIVTNGLICNLDAAFCSSYPTTGTTWYDLSGNGNNGYLNSSQFDSVNGVSGSYLNNLNNQSNFFYFTLSDTDSLYNTLSVTTGGWTIEEVIWTNSTDYPEADAGSLFSDAAYGTNATGFDWNHGVGITSFQFGQSSEQPPGPAYEDVVSVSTSPYNQFNTWRVRTMIWDRGNNTNSLYLNGTYIGGGTTPNTAGTSIYDRGTSYIGTLYGWKFYGRRGSFRIWNRVLSSTEISQNFNVIKARYGL
jgi:hypothetical protein